MKGCPATSERPVQDFARYLIPSMLTMIMLAVYTFTDTFVVGRRLGSTALGAMGVCTPVLTITYAFGFLFGMGGASHYALCKGSGKTEKARQYFSSSVWLALITGSIAAIVLNLVAEPFAIFLGADNASLPYAMPYLRVLLCYIPGFMMDVLMMGFMKNEGHPTVAMVATITGSLLNVVLDFVFVFGLDMGMFGAAFATALCSGIGLCVNIFFAVFLHTNLRLEKPSWHPRAVWNIISNGFSILVLESSSGIVTFVFVHQASRLYGENGAGIYTILMNWSLIFTNLTMGIAQAMQPLVSFACGKERRSLMHGYLRLSILSSLVLGALDTVLTLALSSPMASVFTDDSQAILQGASHALRLYAPAFLLMAFGICIGYFFEAAAMAGKAACVMLLRGVVLPVALSLSLPLVLGGTGLWTTMPASEAVTAIVSLGLLRKSLSGPKARIPRAPE